MPHCIVEYSSNLKGKIDFQYLLTQLNESFLDQPDIFPIAGIRTRLHEVKDYSIANNEIENAAFIHIEYKIGAGRPQIIIERLGEVALKNTQEVCKSYKELNPLAISIEISEFHEIYNYRDNNLREYL